MCDHLLEFKSWKYIDPKPVQGMSYATVTRHLRILRRKIEGLMGKSFRRKEPPWWEVSRYHWDLLWTGEETLRKYGTILWEAGHESITLFPGALEGPIHKVLRRGWKSNQTRTGPIHKEGTGRDATHTSIIP